MKAQDLIGANARDLSVHDLLNALTDRMVEEGECSVSVLLSIGGELFTLSLNHVHDGTDLSDYNIGGPVGHG